MSRKPQVYRTWCRGRVGCVLLFLFLAFIRFPAALPQPPAPHTSAHTWVKQKWGRWTHWCPEFGKIAYTPHSAQHPAAVRAHGRQLPEKETVSSLVPCHSICLGPSVLWHLVEHCLKPEARKLAKLGGTWALELSTCGGWGGEALGRPGTQLCGRSLAADGSLWKSDTTAQLCLPGTEDGVRAIFSPALCCCPTHTTHTLTYTFGSEVTALTVHSRTYSRLHLPVPQPFV